MAQAVTSLNHLPLHRFYAIIHFKVDDKMKKINQGKYEILTTKVDAIDKFMQMQGACREQLSGENPIEFYCSNKGKITITNPPTRSVVNDTSTNLFAKIVEQDDKVYVTYYTAFSQSTNVLKTIYISIYLLMGVFAIIGTIISKVKTYYLTILAFGLISFGIKSFAIAKEETNSSKDSEILINELEKRVEAVNLWNK